MTNYLVIKRTFMVVSLALILWGSVLLPQAADQPRAEGIPEIMAEQSSPGHDASAVAVTAVQANWVKEIRNFLEVFKGEDRTSNLDPYFTKLNLIGDALGQGDRRSVKVEMGSFFQMLARRAYGINAGAADDLANFARMVMPAQEYGIIFPRSGAGRYGTTTSRSESAQRE